MDGFGEKDRCWHWASSFFRAARKPRSPQYIHMFHDQLHVICYQMLMNLRLHVPCFMVSRQLFFFLCFQFQFSIIMLTDTILSVIFCKGFSGVFFCIPVNVTFLSFFFRQFPALNIIYIILSRKYFTPFSVESYLKSIWKLRISGYPIKANFLGKFGQCNINWSRCVSSLHTKIHR